jgi:organic radical activating enzyme
MEGCEVRPNLPAQMVAVDFNKALEIPVMEAFSTLQGEGFHQGKAAFFIRLAGCDVGCVWCDVKESWDVSEKQVRKIKAIVAEASKYKGSIAVITGGEPLMYDLAPLTVALQLAGFQTNIETSGAFITKAISSGPKKMRKRFQKIASCIFNQNGARQKICCRKLLSISNNIRNGNYRCKYTSI